MKKHSSQSTLKNLGLRLSSVVLLLLLLLIFSPALQATKYEILDQSFEFKTGGTVKIDNPSGEVKVEVWAEELVHVTAKKIEPPATPVALSDIAFFSTKSQLHIKAQPAEKTSRIDLTVYVPRNTSLRILTSNGAVQIKGALASALVETSSGNIRLESPPSQDADVVMTTTSGAIRAEIPIDPYGTPTNKSLQGKLNSGGNPVILRSTSGNIQLAALERELDKDVATIPSAPAISSSADSNNYYGNANNNSNNDSLFNSSSPTVSRRPNVNNNNSQPYTYGGSYGGNSGGLNPNSNTASNQPNNSNSNSNNRNNSNNPNNSNNSTDIFGADRDSDNNSSGVDAGNLGVNRNRTNSNTDSRGGVGVKIIPPPTSRSQQSDDYNNQNNQNPNYQNNPSYQSSPSPNNSNPQQPPPLQRRKNSLSGNTNPTNNDNSSSNLPDYNSPSDSQNQDTQDNIARNNRNDRPTPVLKRDNNSNQQNPNQNDDSDDGTIKIDTKLVSLNVSVMSKDGRAISSLKDNNFQVFEDGVLQQIEHFEPVNSPFNLVILIDLSGSTIDKIDVLRRAVLRFIDVCKPNDRIAIVTFTRSVQVVCELTNDRQLIKQRLQYMSMPKGGTAFYEATWFTITQMFKQVEGQRNAVVILSDGVDNSISVTYPMPTRVTFDQILRKVQEMGVLIFPIYLDTEKDNVSQMIEEPGSYVIARKQLGALAESSGGVYFKADRPDNLEGVYEKVAADLRTLYSISYYPTNTNRDGTWRKLKVKVDKADLAVRTRRGYYAK